MVGVTFYKICVTFVSVFHQKTYNAGSLIINYSVLLETLFRLKKKEVFTGFYNLSIRCFHTVVVSGCK